MEEIMDRLENDLKTMKHSRFNDDVRSLLRGIKTMDHITRENNVFLRDKLRELEKKEEKIKELENLLNHYRTILQNSKEA